MEDEKENESASEVNKSKEPLFGGVFKSEDLNKSAPVIDKS
jgi:hypothetical protein